MSMRVSPVVAASLFTLAPILAMAQPIPFERTLTVGAAPSLDVSTGSGSVTVHAGSGATIVVKGTVSINKGWGAPADAAEIAKKVAANPPITQSGDAVQVGKIADEQTRKAVSISYDISVPAATVVAANSGSGNVSVTGVSSGVKANSGSGDVTVANVGGAVDARTGSGNVSIKDARASANLSTGSGNIVAALSGSGDVKASTGSGDITLTGVVGLLSASTGSGSIGVEGKPTGDWKVSSASGDVKVVMPAGQGFTLDASTSSGNLEVAGGLNVEKSPGRRRAQGPVHGGGPAVRLSTASGDIAVR
jgi:hypothetical protein